MKGRLLTTREVAERPGRPRHDPSLGRRRGLPPTPDEPCDPLRRGRLDAWEREHSTGAAERGVSATRATAPRPELMARSHTSPCHLPGRQLRRLRTRRNTMPAEPRGSVYSTPSGKGIRWLEDGKRRHQSGSHKTEAHRWFAENVAPRLTTTSPVERDHLRRLRRPVPGRHGATVMPRTKETIEERLCAQPGRVRHMDAPELENAAADGRSGGPGSARPSATGSRWRSARRSRRRCAGATSPATRSPTREELRAAAEELLPFTAEEIDAIAEELVGGRRRDGGCRGRDGAPNERVDRPGRPTSTGPGTRPSWSSVGWCEASSRPTRRRTGQVGGCR